MCVFLSFNDSVAIFKIPQEIISDFHITIGEQKSDMEQSKLPDISVQTSVPYFI
jgi:hypothetical protein